MAATCQAVKLVFWGSNIYLHCHRKVCLCLRWEKHINSFLNKWLISSSWLTYFNYVQLGRKEYMSQDCLQVQPHERNSSFQICYWSHLPHLANEYLPNPEPAQSGELCSRYLSEGQVFCNLKSGEKIKKSKTSRFLWKQIIFIQDYLFKMFWVRIVNSSILQDKSRALKVF